MLRHVIRFCMMVVVLGASAGLIKADTNPQEQLFAIKGYVVDRSGAIIPQAEVVFKGESGTILAHVDKNGIVNVNLAAGKYDVTIRAYAFATKKLTGFSVPRPTDDTFQVTLEIDQSQLPLPGSD